VRKIKSLAIAGMLLAGSLAFAHEFSGAHGTVAVDWTAPNISRVISSGYGDSFGMEAWVRMGFPEPLEVDGRQCIDGSYLLFDVDDDFAFDIDETVTIEFLFDRTRSSGFWISYDRNVISEPLQEVVFDDSDEQWQTQMVTLERARFANRGESGSDFGIAAPDGLWYGDPEKNHRIVLCDLKISRANSTVSPGESGELILTVNDENGEPTPARIGLYDQTGRMPLPSDGALTIHNYDDRTKQIFLRETHGKIAPWPHDNRNFFYADGEYSASLPAGTYTLVVSKGPEYLLGGTTVEIGEGEATTVEVSLSRWSNMPAAGWYSGDDHVHMTRTRGDDASISAVMRAEDVHVTNLLQMGNPYDTNFTQYAFGTDGRYLQGNHALVPGVEDPRTAVRGHTISMNIREVFRPADRYLRYDQIFGAYREQGGMSGYAHVAGRLFNVERGLALDVPLGAIEFVEVLQDGVLETELWYEFLNLGFSLIPTAGSDFPYLSAPGGERNYVYVGDKFSVDSWYASLRDQRTFVTNGPLLEFTVDGQPMGSHLQVTAGGEIHVRATAALKPDIEKLDRIELVVHGDVVARSDKVTADNSLTLDRNIDVSSGIWVAVRAYGVDQAVAHSAPVYITTGGGFEKRAAVAAIASRMIARLGEFDTVEADARLELESWSVAGPLNNMLLEQKAQILERVDEARAVYVRMLDHP
jgi:hypothetical protein